MLILNHTLTIRSILTKLSDVSYDHPFICFTKELELTILRIDQIMAMASAMQFCQIMISIDLISISCNNLDCGPAEPDCNCVSVKVCC